MFIYEIHKLRIENSRQEVDTTVEHIYYSFSSLPLENYKAFRTRSTNYLLKHQEIVLLFSKIISKYLIFVMKCYIFYYKMHFLSLQSLPVVRCTLIYTFE